jgi:hypothetical protein
MQINCIFSIVHDIELRFQMIASIIHKSSVKNPLRCLGRKGKRENLGGDLLALYRPSTLTAGGRGGGRIEV